MSYMVRTMFARALIPAVFALLAACEVAPPPQAVLGERVLPDLEAQAQAEESCGQVGEACCESGEACAEGHECSEGVCVYPFLEPREPSSAE